MAAFTKTALCFILKSELFNEMVLQSLMVTLLSVPDEYILLHKCGYAEPFPFPMKLIKRNNFTENF